MNISPDMCCEVPLPAEPNEYLFGLAFRSAISSATVLTFRLGCTTSMFGSVASMVIGVKSLSGS